MTKWLEVDLTWNLTTISSTTYPDGWSDALYQTSLSYGTIDGLRNLERALTGSSIETATGYSNYTTGTLQLLWQSASLSTVYGLPEGVSPLLVSASTTTVAAAPQTRTDTFHIHHITGFYGDSTGHTVEYSADDFDQTITTSYYDRYWVSLSLFTPFQDLVNFNNLNSTQTQIMESGEDVSNGGGGGDTVTLPDRAHYDFAAAGSVGFSFSTGSTTSDARTTSTGTPIISNRVYGTDGNYNITLGAGTDAVQITGDGANTITGGSGLGYVTISGSGTETINVKGGTQSLTLAGSATVTINFSGVNQAVSFSDVSQFSGKIYVTGFQAGDYIYFNEGGLSSSAVHEAFDPNVKPKLVSGEPGEVDVWNVTKQIATLVFDQSDIAKNIQPYSVAGSSSTTLTLSSLVVPAQAYEGASGGGQVDWNFIHKREGLVLEPYVLMLGTSGVAVGTGVDLANGPVTKSIFIQEMAKYGITVGTDPNLSWLLPFTRNSGVGLTLEDAVAQMRSSSASESVKSIAGPEYVSVSHSITPAQSTILANYAEKFHFESAVKKATNANIDFNSLPKEMQTVLVDFDYNTNKSEKLISSLAPLINSDPFHAVLNLIFTIQNFAAANPSLKFEPRGTKEIAYLLPLLTSLSGSHVSGAVIAPGESATASGTAAGDLFVTSAGNDSFSGGLGVDTVVFSGARSNYTITHSGLSLIVSGPDGIDTLTGIEKLAFNDTSITVTSQTHSQDFDGSGSGDVMLRASNGNLWLNTYSGATITGGGPAGSPTMDWDVVATADFNGDAKSDVALRNHATGDLWFNFYNGVTIVSSGPGGSPTTDWDVAGTGDFNGDGYSDILLRNHSGGQLWLNLYNGTNIIGSGPAGSPSTDWDVAGIGDFNGDGYSDVMLRNHDTGALWINLYNGVSAVGSGPAGSPSTDWDVAGIGDFNADGYSDVLLHNHNTGELWINLYQGLNLAGSGPAGSPSTDWEVVRVADYNGDGFSDVMLRNHVDGSLYMNLYQGLTPIGSGPAGSPTLDWQFVGV
jgi:hypothetical protein